MDHCIPDGCERIGNKAFAQCAALEMAEIPASVTSIADDAFAGSERLVIVTAEGSYAQTYATNHGIPCVAEYKVSIAPSSGNCPAGRGIPL